MKKITYLTYAALLALCSCTNEINEEGFVDKTNTISFNAYPNKTRAVTGDVTSDNMKDDNFGVVGYFNNKLYLFKSTDNAVEQKWDSNSSTWEYANSDDLKFWPNGTMDFFAYFPYSANATFATDKSTSNAIMIIPTTCAHDVLFAYSGNVSHDNDRVPLNFYHALSKMKSLTIDMPTTGYVYKHKYQVEINAVEFINTSTSGNINVNPNGEASYEVNTTNLTLKPGLPDSNPVTIQQTTNNVTLFSYDNNTSNGYFFATNSSSSDGNPVKGTGKTLWDGTKGALSGGNLSDSDKNFVCLKLTCSVKDADHYIIGNDNTYGDIYIPLNGAINDGTQNPQKVNEFLAGKRYIYKIEWINNIGFKDNGDPILNPILFKVNTVQGWDDVTVTITL